MKEDDKPYVFTEKPPAKSSTSVMAKAGGICQVCGCKAGVPRKDCRCTCHNVRGDYESDD